MERREKMTPLVLIGLGAALCLAGAGTAAAFAHFGAASESLTHLQTGLLRLTATALAAAFAGCLIWFGALALSRGVTTSEGFFRSLSYLALALWTGVVLTPFLWLLFNSFKDSNQIFSNPYALPKALTEAGGFRALIENYRSAWVDSNFNRYFLNSFKVVLITLGLQLLVASMAAYAIARFRFRINKVLLFFFICGMMVPAQITIFPLFFQYIELSEFLTRWVAPVFQIFGYENPQISLLDTHTGLILIYVAGGLPFSILILTGFFRSIPEDLYESALIDGCGEFRAFWSIMLPMARPGLATVAIFSFIGIFNEYMTALIYITSDELKTIPLGLAYMSSQAQYAGDYGKLFAGIVVAMIPTFAAYMLFQKQITRGITAGAAKG